MKRSELMLMALHVPLDYLMLLAAAAVAYGIRSTQVVERLRPSTLEESFLAFMLVAAPLMLVVLGIFALTGMYRPRRKQNVAQDVASAFIGVSVGLLGFVVYAYFTREFYESRFILLTFWGLAILFVPIGRFVLRKVQTSLFRRGKYVRNVVLVGNGPAAQRLQGVYADAGWGRYVIASIPHANESAVQELQALFQEHEIDEVVITSADASQSVLLSIQQFVELQKASFALVPDLFGTFMPRFENTDVAGIPVFQLERTPLEGWGRVVKRVIDILGASIFCILFAPWWAIIALAIVLDTKGPVLYRSVRISRNGEFTMYKFRSMVKDAERMKPDLMKRSERKGPFFKMQDDPRITRVGRFLRKTRIDEVPQLINVLLGDMSLVGPRPHLPEEVEQYEPHHRRVLTINGGMTGLAQVSGSSDLTFEEEMRLDTYYLENWSLTMDLGILFRTVRVVIGRKFGS